MNWITIDHWEKIAICWYPWTWKTTLLKVLAKILSDYKLVDLDDEFPNQPHWMWVKHFIETFDKWIQPLSHFRKSESQTERDVLHKYKDELNVLLALWWWTLSEHEYLEKNIWMLRKLWYTIIYVKAELEDILSSQEGDIKWNKNRVWMDHEKIYPVRDKTFHNIADIVVQRVEWDSEKTWINMMTQYNSFKFNEYIISPRMNINQIDDELIECFNWEEENYLTWFSWNITFPWDSLKHQELILEYAEKMFSEINSRLWWQLTQNEMNLLTNRLVQVADVADIKIKYKQESLQKWRKASVKQKYVSILWELWWNLYEDIIHHYSEEMERRIMNQK